MLPDRCLSVCPVCEVGVLWPNGWTDQDETWHGGRPRPWPHCDRWGPSSPSPAGWIQMLLGMEAGLSPGDFVLDGDPTPTLRKGGGAPSPIFGPFLLWPNGSMHQDATCYECKTQLRGLCVRWRPSPPKKGGGASHQIFGPCLFWPNGWTDQDATWHGGRPQPRRLCVRWGPSPSSAHAEGVEPLPNFRPIFIVAKRLDASKCHLVYGGRPQRSRLCVR